MAAARWCRGFGGGGVGDAGSCFIPGAGLPMQGRVSKVLRRIRLIAAYARHRNLRLTLLDTSDAIVADSGRSAIPVDATLAQRLVAGPALLSPAKTVITAVSSGNGPDPAQSRADGNWR